MKKLNLIFAIIFGLTFSSCHVALEALEALAEAESTNTTEQQPAPPSTPSSDSSSSTKTSPAPSTPLPPPSPSTKTNSSGGSSGTDMTAFYRAIKLSDNQITEFEAITKEYKSKMNSAKLKYKADPTALKKELNSIRNQQEGEYKEMMSSYQYSLFQKEMKKMAEKSTKGSIGG